MDRIVKNECGAVYSPVLTKHIENNKVAASYLVLHKDIAKLRALADCFAEYFNKADIFRLESNPSIQVKETEAFIDKVLLASIGNKKLFIISDFSAMTIAAQNKMLKTIEDLANDIFLLLATNAESVLNTIKSRCVIVYPNFPPAADSAGKIDEFVSKLIFDCKSIDDALPYIPFLSAKENIAGTLVALSAQMSKILKVLAGLILPPKPIPPRFTIRKVNDILNRSAIIERNIASNCNAQNAFDSLLIEMFLKECK